MRYHDGGAETVYRGCPRTVARGGGGGAAEARAAPDPVGRSDARSVERGGARAPGAAVPERDDRDGARGRRRRAAGREARGREERGREERGREERGRKERGRERARGREGGGAGARDGEGEQDQRGLPRVDSEVADGGAGAGGGD
eukprot:2629497-Rhodomonas_salina.1